MAGIGRATLVFKSGEHGWTESYVKGVVDNLEELIEPARALLKARRLIMQQNVEIPFIRLSEINTFRDALIIEAPKDEKFGVYDFKADMPWTCLLVRMESGSKYRKSVYLRGVPDTELTTSTGGITEVTEGYRDAVIKNLKKALISGQGWGFMARNQEPKNDAATINYYAYIKNVKIDVDGSMEVETHINHNLVADVPTLINITGVKGTKSVNGIHKMKAVVSATKFTLHMDADTRDYLGGGFYKWHKPVYRNITEVRVVKVGHRDTGRNFASPRGRRLTRKK